jgi:fatty-acyl-CoA synthase
VLVGDMIRLNGKHRGGSEALVVEQVRLTYAELDIRIDDVASALLAAGVKFGDRVAALGKNSVEYLLLYFATARIGAILVPLNFWHRAAEHDYTIANADPGLVFVEPEYQDVLDPKGRRRILLPTGGATGEWDQFLTAGHGRFPGPEREIQPEDPHMILYTSGTTGRPRGAVLSHRRTMDDAFSMAAVLGARGDDTFFNYFPPFHVGNWDHMKLFLLVGARVIMLRQFDATEVLRTIPAERVSVLLGVPTMLHDLLSHPDFPATDTSSVRLVYYGAYDPSDVMRRTADAFGVTDGRCEMAHTFGLTEAGPFVTICRSYEMLDHWGSIGLPLPGVEVELLDDDGLPVQPGSPGELCMRGPRMTAYWNDAPGTASALVGGWLHTGDIAVADDQGFLFIVDRKKDMIRSGGQNVYSKTVEDCLQLHDDVAEAAVIGVPDAVYEEQVCAIIVLRDGVPADDSTKTRIQQYVRASLAGYNCPRSVHFAPELPRNAVGKIQKHLLRASYGSIFSGTAGGRDPG